MAIGRIQLASSISLRRYNEPIMVAYSGGKDSDLTLELVKRSEVPFTVEHNHTTADAPETVYHVRETLARFESQGIPCKINPPVFKGEPCSMWKLIEQKGMPPTRIQRYCCAVLKEGGGKGKMVTTGVRWAESNRRKATRGIYETHTSKIEDKTVILEDNEDSRNILETCRVNGRLIVNPIVDWTDREVWQYIKGRKIKMNPLYGCGFSRVGCIGCPMAGKKRWTEFNRYPTYKKAYLKAFEKMLALRLIRRPEAMTKWKTPADVFRWWMEDKNLDGQLSFYDEDEIWA